LHTQCGNSCKLLQRLRTINRVNLQTVLHRTPEFKSKIAPAAKDQI
jgi:hypothetical protein